jgi:hypothetical protein
MSLDSTFFYRLDALPTAILFQPGTLKDRRERCTTAVRERKHPGLAIVRDESPDGHGLHRMGEDADRPPPCDMTFSRR